MKRWFRLGGCDYLLSVAMGGRLIKCWNLVFVVVCSIGIIKFPLKVSP
jgi:hypothetical protein